MIRVLPANIANLIAAGEVIQRPSSVVKELMENAVDAGASQITLVVNDSGRTLVQVIDNGCGMEEKELTRITEAFYMVDKSRARKEGGAGLGMTLCSRILDLHGARWKISSIPGKGTSIALWFPGRKEGSGE